MATKKSGTKSNNTKTSKRGTASGSTASKKTTKQGTGKSGAGAQKAKRKPTKKAIAKKRSFVIGEVAAIILAFLSVFMFLSNFGLLGGVGEFFAEIQKGLFGMMGYVFPLYLIFTIFYIHFIENDPLFGFKTASVIVLFFIIVALTQFIFGTKEAFSFGEFYELGGAGEFISGAAGGAIGGFITNGIAGALGRVGAFLIIFTLLLITVVVLLEKSFINAVRNGGIFAKESAEKTMGYARERYETQKIARDARREAARLKALEERFEDKPQGSGFDRFDLSRHGRNTAEYEQNVIDDNELPAVNEAAMDATFNDAEAGTNIGTEAVALSQEDGLLAIENRAFAEPDYDIDDVPFDETEEDKYRAYDQMISGNAIGIKTAESLGFAVSHGARVPVTEVSTDEPVMTEEVFNPDEPSLDDELFDATLFDRDYLHKPLNPDEIVYPDIRNASAQGSAGAGVNVNGAANAWNNAGMGAKGGAYDGGNAGFEGDGSYDPYAGSTGNANVGGLDSSDSGEGLDGHDDYNDYNEYNEYSEYNDYNGYNGFNEYDDVTAVTVEDDIWNTGAGSSAAQTVAQTVAQTGAQSATRSGAQTANHSGAKTQALNRAQSTSQITVSAENESLAQGENQAPSKPALSPEDAQRELDRKRELERKKQQEVKVKPYQFPPVSLLAKGMKSDPNANGMDQRANARKLEQVIREFGVGVTCTNIVKGPRVTRFELTPDVGVRVNKITALAGDIKLALAAKELRIEAPIPGKSAVGIEVPNEKSAMVTFRDIMDTREFKEAKGKLTWGIGLDIQGSPIVGNIAKMPHLLISGTTGSGKSVAVNTVIMSILYRCTPEEVKMILIDPKVVELSIYDGIPHLLTPVVTKPSEAVAALSKTCDEMNRRYRLFKESNTRNIKGYNDKVDEISKMLPEGAEKPEKLPYILVVIDELAELMMHSKKDVETYVASITQLARAAGIHLIVVTQRPSVDVVTGLIKSNIPSRVGLKLPSAIDSRTILDQGGAESLLGNGDMLCRIEDMSTPVRVQGAFLADEEVDSIVEWIKKHNSTIYSSEWEEALTAAQNVTAGASGMETVSDDGSGHDEYFYQAGVLITEKNKASIGMLQRKFSIGFNRASRIMDQLFEAGVVSDSLGTKERQILMTNDEFKRTFGNE